MPSQLNLYLCGNCSSQTIDEEESNHSIPVKLNIYDVVDVGPVFSFLGLGVYHSGVEVYDKGIYAYGGHSEESTGIYSLPPKTCEFFNLPYSYRLNINKQTVLIGHTKLSEQQIEALVHEMAISYSGNAYRLIQQYLFIVEKFSNCNHFSEELSQKLCQKSIPSYVNRIASLVSSFPFLIKFVQAEQFNSQQQPFHKDFED
ncbi:hypothetical protein HZS_7676 [Henneguya salminicola]|nr:hypothetical protein HZS_7676 [Henneguya salminicola]